MRNYILLLLFAMSLMTGCLDDKLQKSFIEINTLDSWENRPESRYTLYEDESIDFNPTPIFTLDVEPNFSYEWWVDTEVKSREKAFTFVGDTPGTFILSHFVKENVSGVKYGMRVVVEVQSKYKAGWMLLSDNGGNSELSMVFLKPQRVPIIGDSERSRDSLVYNGHEINIAPNLGNGPISLTESWLLSDYGAPTAEVVVMQSSGAVTLNGDTFDKVNLLEEDFTTPVAGSVKALNAVFNGSSNYILNSDKMIYAAVTSIGNLPHMGEFSNIPLSNGRKFNRLIETMPCTPYVLAIDEFNTIYGFVRSGNINSEDGVLGTSNFNDTKLITIADKAEYDMTLFKDSKGLWERLLIMNFDDLNQGYGEAFVALLKEKSTNNLYLHFFELSMGNVGVEKPRFSIVDTRGEHGRLVLLDKSLSNNFVDACAFPASQTIAIASGNTLYYYDDYGFMTKVKTFEDNIKRIAAKDAMDWNMEYEGPHVAVVLENGNLYILSINRGDTENSTELYKGSGFGNVIDLKFKWSDAAGISYSIYTP